MKIRPTFLLFVVASLFLGALVLSFKSSGAQAFKQRVVARLSVEANEPVGIRAVRAGGLKLLNGRKFLAGDDWLRDLTITITNRTRKPNYLCGY